MQIRQPFVFTFAQIAFSTFRMNFVSKIIFFLFFSFCFVSGFSQTKLNSLDLNQIKQKSIRKFIADLETQGVVYFEDLHPSVNSQTDSGKFDSNCHYFRNKHALQEVWNAYLTVHPASIWNGRIVSLGFIYSPRKGQIVFQEDKYDGLELGQVFFIEMRVFFGLVHFPVCFVVTGLNAKQHSISFSYIQEGLSKGAQTIKLIAKNASLTEIKHSSIHLTDNVLRDKTLYPIYHRKAISEVHRNIIRFLEQN